MELKDFETLDLEQTSQWFCIDYLTKYKKYEALANSIDFSEDYDRDLESMIDCLSKFLYVIDKRLFLNYNCALKKELEIMMEIRYNSLHKNGIFPKDLITRLNNIGSVLASVTELSYSKEDLDILCNLGEKLTFKNALSVVDLVNRRIPGLLNKQEIFVIDAKHTIDDILSIVKH